MLSVKKEQHLSGIRSSPSQQQLVGLIPSKYATAMLYMTSSVIKVFQSNRIFPHSNANIMLKVESIVGTSNSEITTSQYSNGRGRFVEWNNLLQQNPNPQM